MMFNRLCFFLRVFFAGIVMGIANVIPGVSGATMAVVLGIYDDLIDSITWNLKRLWAKRVFIVPLIVGLIVGILIFSKFIGFLYERFPIYTDFVLIGIILGSFPMIFKSTFLTSYDKQGNKVTGCKPLFSKIDIFSIVFCMFFGFGLLFCLSLIDSKIGMKEVASLTDFRLNNFLVFRLLFAGFCGALAMIIPGISGSLMLVILGVYPIIISSILSVLVSEYTLISLGILVPVAIGAFFGVFAGAKFISFFMKKFPHHVYGLILGLVAGSILAVLPNVSEMSSFSILLGVLICFIISFVVYLLSKIE